jgi:hypothetical protein
MPALADACHLLRAPLLAPREASGTPAACLRHLWTAGGVYAWHGPCRTASLSLLPEGHIFSFRGELNA